MTAKPKGTPPVDEAILQNLIEFVANRPQAQAYTVMPNEMYAFIGRGGGKTVGIIAPWILHKVTNMPRSNGGLICKTFTDGETKILQPLFLAFTQLGLEKDVDYVYGKKPPEDWAKPLTPIIDYSYVLSFPNGTTMEMISLHLKGSANGKSLQWIVCDEAKFVNEVQLRGEVFPILRGHVRHFGESPWYGAKLFVTDKLSPNMHWLLAKRKLVDKDQVKAVMYFQLELNSAYLELSEAIDNLVVRKLQKRIRKYEKILAVLRKNLVYVVEASAQDNIANLSADFFENMKRSLSPYEYRVAILNHDPTRVENCFYPDRNESHTYTADHDDDISKPLGVVLDYQASISPLVSFQVNSLVTGFNTLNFLRSDYVKHPFGIKDVIDQFCKHHEDRPCKEIHYFFDTTAIGRVNEGLTYSERVIKYFEDNKWKVNPVYMGKGPDKDVQYESIKDILQNREAKPYQVRFNLEGCNVMILAMDLAETRQNSKGKTVKYKYLETVLTYPQEFATHFPDCFDQAIHAVITMDLYPFSTFTRGGVNGFRER